MCMTSCVRFFVHITVFTLPFHLGRSSSFIYSKYLTKVGGTLFNVEGSAESCYRENVWSLDSTQCSWCSSIEVPSSVSFSACGIMLTRLLLPSPRVSDTSLRIHINL